MSTSRQLALVVAASSMGTVFECGEDQSRKPGVLAVLLLFVLAAAALYGPQAAALVEVEVPCIALR